MTARILLEETAGQHDPLLALHRITYPQRQPVHTPDPMKENETDPNIEISGDTASGHEKIFADAELIENFLSKGEHRIIPDDNTPEYDAAENSSVLNITDDMVSEELAEIYLAQGLKAQAREIYARLSLLNPEKSIYFADIIGKIDSGHDQ